MLFLIISKVWLCPRIFRVRYWFFFFSKKHFLVSWVYFCPIYLCYMSNNVLTKLLVLRLALLLLRIFLLLSGLVPGRVIRDNLLLV